MNYEVRPTTDLSLVRDLADYELHLLSLSYIAILKMKAGLLPASIPGFINYLRVLILYLVPCGQAIQLLQWTNTTIAGQS